MKKIIYTIIAIAGLQTFHAQALIDKTKAISTSSSLEFGDNQNRGVVIPWAKSAAVAESNGAVDGTLIFDQNDFRVKARENGVWKDYSQNNYGNTIDSQIQNGTDDVAKKAIMGATKSTAPGVLVLEESNKAMILPRESSPHLNVKNPTSGTIVYDTVSKEVAFYNGSQWTFWK